MKQTIRYSSTRSEVWRWYLRSWKTKLWRLHIPFAALISVTSTGRDFNHFNTSGFLLHFVFSVVLLFAISALFPQIRFKKSVRTLEVGTDGWSSTVGKVSGSRTWAEVASITRDDGAIIIQSKNGNSLIIPARAFPDMAAQQRFFEEAEHWHRSYKSQAKI